MFSEKNIVVTIGSHGCVIAVHEGNNIKNKIFLDELNDDAQKHLAKEVFAKNKSAPVYILLDTVDQSYKRKTYPLVRRNDLNQIIKRDLANDGDKDSLKNFIILNEGKGSASQLNRRWEALFVSAPNSENLNKWIEFLLNMPNHLKGIYMLPLETFSLFKILQKNIESKSKLEGKGGEIFCFIIHTKVSGLRQIVFSDKGIVFSRVVDYHFDQPNFLEKYEHDLYSTFEYLKRLFPNLTIQEFNVVNILSSEAIELIKTIHNVELNFINYTPRAAADAIGYGKFLPENSNFCDLLISKVFSSKKKILKFSTNKIKLLDRYFLILSTSYYVNLAIVLVICASTVLSIISQEKVSESVEAAETSKFNITQNLLKLKQAAMATDADPNSTNDISLERVIDFGKTEELLGKTVNNFNDFYGNLKFLKNFRVKLDRFSYNLTNFNAKAPTAPFDYDVKFGGQIVNKTGDIEDLFREFDSLILEVKKNMPKNSIKYNELPRNIDFNKKYYEFPIEFTISSKK